jgi:hypothetical protein
MRRLLLLSLTLVASLTVADVIAPAEAECRSKKAGDPCRAEFGQGVCAAAKCTRNDYSEGPPPKQKQVDCLMCGTPAAADAGTPMPLKKSPTKAK